MSVFLQSTSILLREGLEALLVVAALAAYLEKSGARDRLSALYWGAGAAVLASIAAAAAFEAFNNGAHDDTFEAVIILGAAALMLYVSGWLFLRQDPKAWQGFLKTKAEQALAKQTGSAVAALAFLSVFREGAETVLFIHALAQTNNGWSLELISGLATAAAVLILLFYTINVVARRLPMRLVFLVTSAFLFVMAIKFIGQAIQEFQEQLLIPYTMLTGAGWLSNIGLNPTLEAIGIQGAVVLLAVLTFLVIDRRARLSAGVGSKQVST